MVQDKYSAAWVWKTIELGSIGVKDVGGYKKAINDAGMYICDYCLSNATLSEVIEKTEVDLVVVYVERLGFKDGTDELKDIYAAAKKLGLELCSNEVAFELRLQHKDRPIDMGLLIGMEPINGSDGFLYVFYLENRNGTPSLTSRGGSCSGHIWNSRDRFVFVLPRK